MKVWAACVVVFFGVVELYQWLQHVALPLPVYGVAGLLLAVISNSDKWQPLLPARSKGSASVPASTPTSALAAEPSQPLPVESPTAEPSTTEAARVLPHQRAHLQLPNLTPPVQSSISFTIRQPEPAQKGED